MKREHYLAQIAAEIRKSRVSTPNSVQVKDFIVLVGPAPKPETSRQIWADALGIDLKKKKRPDKRALKAKILRETKG